jgi:dCMP deaminase
LDILKALRLIMPTVEAQTTNSKDPSTKTASVAFDDDFNILATGYNGFPRGIADTEERLNTRELKYKLVVHGEANMICSAARSGHSLKGSTVMVSTLFPCSSCAGLMVQAGVKRVITTKPDIERWRESNELAQAIFDEGGVEVIIVEEVRKDNDHWIELPDTEWRVKQ